jgi:hypothetical protein
MDRFKYCRTLAYVCAEQYLSSDKGRRKDRILYRRKIRQNHNIKFLGPHNKLHAKVIDDNIIGFNLRIILCHFPEYLKEQTVRKLHDIRLVNTTHLTPVFALGKLESKPDYPF